MGFYYSESIRQDLTFILNKGFCHYTYVRAAKKYNSIQDKLLEKDRIAIWNSLFNLVLRSKLKLCQYSDCLKSIRDRQTCEDSICFEFTDELIADAKKANYLMPVRRGC
ncbi:MAG: hypothetical protein IKP66_04260 [Lachnospiraceae bacterium]|nr:hypothetical protein [Lachnospiraceae bacterium]